MWRVEELADNFRRAVDEGSELTGGSSQVRDDPPVNEFR
jgi:hypothetical protein